MAAKFFTGLPLDGPDPECVRGHGAEALSGLAAGAAAPPRPSADHSHRGPVRGPVRGQAGPVPVTIGRPPARARDEHPAGGLAGRPPARACDENPLSPLSAR